MTETATTSANAGHEQRVRLSRSHILVALARVVRPLVSRLSNAGMQVPPTREGVASGLRHMAEASADQLRAMGACGRHSVLQEFSWKRTAQKLFQAYDRRQLSQSLPEQRETRLEYTELGGSR